MSNTPKVRRQARLERQRQRVRQLRYCEQAGGSWKLDGRELFELDSLTARIERARAAQLRHERRIDVQLELAEVA